MNWRNRIIIGDAAHLLRALPHVVGGVPLILFSPPYNLNMRADGRSTAACYPNRGITRRKGHYRDDAPYGARGGAGKWKNGTAYDGYEDALPWPIYTAFSTNPVCRTKP